MLTWQKYFDKIICINLKGHKTRKNLMKAELKRVGILKHPNFEWEVTYNNSLEEQYISFLKNNGKDIEDISSLIGYISLIKRAYYQGCENILILEDNIRFLKDLDKIQQILQNIPENQDIIIFNKQIENQIHYFNTIKNKRNLINKYYCNKFNVKNSNCFSLDKKAMKQIISLFEVSDYTTINQKIENNLYISYWNKVFSITNLAVNITFFDKNNSIDENEKKIITLKEQLNYKKQGVNFNDYMMRKDGSPYNSGDWIEE